MDYRRGPERLAGFGRSQTIKRKMPMTNSLDWVIIASPNFMADSKMTTGNVMSWPGFVIAEAMECMWPFSNRGSRP